MRRLLGSLGARPLGFLVLSLPLAVFTAPSPLSADIEVLVPGGSRTILARSGDPLDGGGFLRTSMDRVFWLPDDPDHTDVTNEGFFFLNHELAVPNGGLSRLRYKNGLIVERQDWITGTHYNCAGNISWWGTILSCEEHPPQGNDAVGFLVEVYLSQPDTWVRRTPMGRFSHEDVIEDPVTGHLYLTDDTATGVLFKFVPSFPGYLGSGTLYALNETTRQWIVVSNPLQAEEQAIALGASHHPRPEGLAYNPIDDAIYIMVTGVLDDPSAYGYILRLDPRTNTMARWLDGDGSTLANPDNVEIDDCGNLIVQEDMYSEHRSQFGPNQVLLIHQDRSITPILIGLDTTGEPSGLTLDEGGRRFWLNWMNGVNGSELIEVRMPANWNCAVAALPATIAPSTRGLRLFASPNPFSSMTWLHGRVEPGERVRLDIYDARGAHWRTLADGPIAGGDLEVAWDGLDHRQRRAPRGYYFARLSAGPRSTATRVVLMR